MGYTANNPDRVRTVITIDTPYLPNADAKASVKMIDKAFDNYIRKNQDAVSKSLLDAALNVGTAGSQTEYTEIGGLRDLAGQTDALDNIRKNWNTNQANGRLSNVQTYAIATDSVDTPFIGKFSDSFKGDGVVSLKSQQGEGFNNIFVETIIAHYSDRNSIAYSHVGIQNQDIIASWVGTNLGFESK